MTTEKTILAKLFPPVKKIVIAEGDTALSGDVRLVTSNVLPLQRKTMRSILSAAGIRVVANKKKFIIEARVVDFAELNAKDVPAGFESTYYELQLDTNKVYIKASSQEGILLGTYTLASIYMEALSDAVIPNLTVYDWTQRPIRAMYADNSLPTNRMVSSDWYAVVDRLAELKINYFFMPIYSDLGAMAHQEDPLETAGIDAKNSRTGKVYSLEDGWQDEEFYSYHQKGDMFKDIYIHALEKGLYVIPSIVLSENSPMPADQASLEEYCEAVISRYFPKGLTYFNVSVPGVNLDEFLHERGMKNVLSVIPEDFDNIRDLSVNKLGNYKGIDTVYTTLDPAWTINEAIFAGHLWTENDDVDSLMKMWLEQKRVVNIDKIISAYKTVLAEDSDIAALDEASIILTESVTEVVDEVLSACLNSLIAECAIRKAKLEKTAESIKEAMRVVLMRKPDFIAHATINQLATMLS